MRPTSLLPHHALAALLLLAALPLAAGACTQAISAPPAPIPVPIPADPSATPTPSGIALAAPAASASALPKAPAPPPAPQPPLAAWTDPGALAELARSCAWAPADDTPDDPGPLSCQVHFEQTCNPIDCDIEYQDRCLPGCKTSCNDCAETCRKTCSACAAPCAGDACRTACAGTTGACLQACLKEEDHCASGTCGQALDACFKKYQAAFEKSKCERLRPKFSACVETCVEHPPRELLKETSDFMRGRACQDRCVVSVLGTTCSPFIANLRIF